MSDVGRKAEPICDVAHADIGRERRARKVLRPWLARDAITPDINLMRPYRITPGGRAGAGHRVGRKEHASGGLGTDEIL